MRTHRTRQRAGFAILAGLAIIGVAVFMLAPAEPGARASEVGPESTVGTVLGSEGAFEQEALGGSSSKRDALDLAEGAAPMDLVESEPVAEARDVALRDEWIGNEAVTALADFLGVPAVEILPDILDSWPDLLDQEIQPLGDWSEIEPHFAEDVTSQFFGNVDNRDVVFEQKVLGAPLEALLKKRLGEGATEDSYWSAYSRCQDLLYSKRMEFGRLADEYSVAMHAIVDQGDYDRFPYLAIDRFKKNSLPDSETVYALMGSSPGNWVWTITISESEFPQLAAVKSEFEEGLFNLKSEVLDAIDQ